MAFHDGFTCVDKDNEVGRVVYFSNLKVYVKHDRKNKSPEKNYG